MRNFFLEVQPHPLRFLDPDTCLALISLLVSRKGHGSCAEDPDGSWQRCSHQGWWLLPGRAFLVSQVKSLLSPLEQRMIFNKRERLKPCSSPEAISTEAPRSKHSQPHDWVLKSKERLMLMFRPTSHTEQKWSGLSDWYWILQPCPRSVSLETGQDRMAFRRCALMSELGS